MELKWSYYYTDFLLKKKYLKTGCRIQFLVLKFYKYVIEYIIWMKLLFLNGNVEVLEIPTVDSIYGLLSNASNYVASFIHDMNPYTWNCMVM